METRRFVSANEVLRFEEPKVYFTKKPSVWLVLFLVALTTALLIFLFPRVISHQTMRKVLTALATETGTNIAIFLLLVGLLLLFLLFHFFLTKKMTLTEQAFQYGRRRIPFADWRKLLQTREITILRGEAIYLPTKGRPIILRNNGKINALPHLVWQLEQALRIPLYLNFTGNLAEYEEGPSNLTAITDLATLTAYRAKRSLLGAVPLLLVGTALFVRLLAIRQPSDPVAPFVVFALFLLGALWTVFHNSRVLRQPEVDVLSQWKNKPIPYAESLYQALNTDFDRAVAYCGLSVGSHYLFGKDRTVSQNQITNVELSGYIKHSNRRGDSGLHITLEFTAGDEFLLDHSVYCQHLKEYDRMVELLDQLRQTNPAVVQQRDSALDEIARRHFVTLEKRTR